MAATTCISLLALLLAPMVLALPVDIETDIVGNSSVQKNATFNKVKDSGPNDVQAPDVTLLGLGTVRGTVSATEQAKRPIFSYFGIPFAEAPTGWHRFLAPVPKLPWEGVLDATKPGNICIQTDQSAFMGRRRREATPAETEIQSEDCLVLNVHTPKVDPSAKLPVLIFVHGGSFLTGSAGLKTPQGLLDDDVILVSPQYRLGPLGFLNLQTDDVPGNAGLLDIVEAVRWVNKNIEQFGGDPTKITLGGHSAGAAAASLLYLSPLTKGLIRGALPMSGSGLSSWGYDRSPVKASTQITMMATCGMPIVNVDIRISCLKTIPAKKLAQGFLLTAVASLLNGELGMSGAIPSVQEAGVKVLPDLPENILASTDFTPLPYLTGVTKHEGTFPLELAVSGYLTPNKLTTDASFLRNDLLHVLLRDIGHDDSAGFVADAATKAFLDPTTLGNYDGMLDGIIDFLGAFAFKSPAKQIVQRISDRGQPSSYLYTFNYNGVVTKNSATGIYHGADQPYLFPEADRAPFVDDDLSIALALRKLVANFVIYQNPTPPEASETAAGSLTTWTPFARDSEHYLELVWPPTDRQWFSSELTVARRDKFSEHGEQDATALTANGHFAGAPRGSVRDWWRAAGRDGAL